MGNYEMTKQANKGIKFLNVLWLIPILVLGYIGWMNLLPLGGTKTYLIDVGGEDTSGNAKIAGPIDRISDKKIGDPSFRELEKDLVYFKLEDLRLKDADEIGVKVRFKDNFPAGAKLVLGAQNKEEWSYLWKNSYVPFLQKLETLPLLAEDNFIEIYSTGRDTNAGIQNVYEFLRNPPFGSVIARSDKDLSINQRLSEEHLTGIDLNQFTIGDVLSKNVDTGEDGSLRIKTALRGGHTLWTYLTNGLLVLEITKQDLNWYEGPDELTIGIYSVDGKIRGKIAIPDDGDESISKQIGQLQHDTLYISGLEPGAYRIELKSGNDLLIREIAINQSKLVVANRIFPVGINRSYFKDGPDVEPIKLYGKYLAMGEVRFHTWHKSGLQRITVRTNDFETELDINETQTDFRMSLKPGVYQYDVPEQNVIIETIGYFSFTPESFFLPQRCEVVDLKYDMTWLKENVDYVVVNYKDYMPPVVDTEGWLVGQTSWQTKDLYITDDKLSFCLNVPHLESQPENVVPVDWIEISLKVPPVWERIRWSS